MFYQNSTNSTKLYKSWFYFLNFQKINQAELFFYFAISVKIASLSFLAIKNLGVKFMENNKFKVVLLETNESEMENFKQNFKSTKVEIVKSFTDIDKLTDYLKNNKIDMLVSELVLKKGDGYSLLEKIKGLNLSYDLKTVMISGLSGEGFIQKALDMGFDKNIIVLTRPVGYRKKPMPWFVKILAKRVYKKYPKFIQAMFERYQMYNNQVDLVAGLQKQGKIIVIRPSRFIDISRMETNLDTIKQMYQLGREDAQQMLPQIKAFLKKKSAP